MIDRNGGRERDVKENLAVSVPDKVIFTLVTTDTQTNARSYTHIPRKTHDYSANDRTTSARGREWTQWFRQAAW